MKDLSVYVIVNTFDPYSKLFSYLELAFLDEKSAIDKTALFDALIGRKL
jgi:hypothetical protein